MIIDEKTMINGDKIILEWNNNNCIPFQIWVQHYNNTWDRYEEMLLYYTSKNRGEAYKVFNDYNTDI